MSNTTKNEHTGDDLVTKPASDLYRRNWDAIFGKEEIVEEVKRRVVCAALLSGDGAIVCGPRHYDRVMSMQIGQADWRTAKQGFVDQYGHFMSREEAFVVATEAGQIIRRVGGDNGRLFSENLY